MVFTYCISFGTVENMYCYYYYSTYENETHNVFCCVRFFRCFCAFSIWRICTQGLMLLVCSFGWLCMKFGIMQDVQNQYDRRKWKREKSISRKTTTTNMWYWCNHWSKRADTLKSLIKWQCIWTFEQNSWNYEKWILHLARSRCK